MICIICRQAEVIHALTSVILERGEIRLVTHHVPAHLCPNCGEVYVDEDVAAQLLQGAEQRSLAGELDGIVAYESL